MKTKKNTDYAWFVCAGCALLLFCTSGLCINAFTIYQPYILTQNAFTNAQTSLIVTVRSLTSFAAMLLCGLYYRRLSLRAGMGLAGALVAGAFFLFGAARSFFVYCLAGAAAGLGYGFGTMIPVSIVMERWFIEKRTLAVGLCSAVTGLSTLGIPSVLTGMIERRGLSVTFYAEGFVMALLVLLSFLLVRSRPADIGREPYGSWERIDQETFRLNDRALRKKDWLLLVPALLCMGAVTSVGYGHLTMLAKGEGFSPDVIAAAVTVSGISLTAGKFVYGWLTEKLSAYVTNWICGGLTILGLVLCCSTAGKPWLLYLAMAVYGMGLPLVTVGQTVWAGDLAGPDQYDRTIQRFQTLYAAGGLLFSSLPGILADHADGSYVPAYMLFTFLAIFLVLSIQWLYRKAGAAKQ
ncbi:MAG: MFS transporter [Oscillospiraceae bacterium]|nr:MFS transporter [Oscillospiraceae bacterium]